MNYIYFGLLCEGPTDRAALPPLINNALCWLRAGDDVRAHFEWDLALLGKSSFEEVVAAAQSGHYDVILAHADGAGAPRDVRQRIKDLEGSPVPVVPVRETEAWLIVDVEAFRKATRAPASRRLPPALAPRAVEQQTDPKQVATELLEACLGRKPAGRGGEIEQWYSLVAGQVRLDRLSKLKWFRRFVADLRQALVGLGWPFKG